jgi:hypothetical protein
LPPHRVIAVTATGAPSRSARGTLSLRRGFRAMTAMEENMADDPHRQGGADRSRVSGSEDYEVRYFADQNGISIDQARELIRTHGNNRDALNAAAQSLKKA